MTLTRTQRRFLTLLATIGIPILLQEVLHQGVNMLDTLMIGRAMSVYEVTAVGLAGQISFLFILANFGVLSACGVYSGQYNGADNTRRIHHIMGIAFMGTATVAGLFFVGSFFFGRALLGVYTDNTHVIGIGADFLRLVSVSFFVMAFVTSRNMAMRSMGQTRLPLYGTIAAFSTNMSFNYVAIFVLGWGLTGVAVGTVLSRLVELGVQSYLIRRYKLPIRTTWGNYFSFDRGFVRAFVAVGGFIMLNEILWAVGTSAHQVAYGMIGVYAQGAIQMSLAVVNIFQILSNAVAITTSVIITNAIGSGKLQRAKVYSQYCIAFTIVATVLMGVLLVSVAPVLAQFYNVSDAIRGDIVRIIRVAGLTMFLRGLNFTVIVGILRSGSDAPFCFKVEMATVYLVALPLVFGGALLGLPVFVLYALVQAEELVKLSIMSWRYTRGKWAHGVIES